MNPESYHEMHKMEDNHWWYVGRRAIIDQVIRTQISHKSEILEVGAGTGGNIAMLLNYGKVTVLEPNQFAQEKIKEEFSNKVTIISGSLPDNLNLPNQKFDLICLFDVLEHLQDDRASLSLLKQFLKPNGKIIATVPAFQFLWSSHDEVHHHFRRYNAANLKLLISQSGFQIKKITYFNFFLFPIAAIVRLMEKLFPSKTPNHQACPNFLNKLLSQIFASEKLWIRYCKFCCGLSLLVVITP